MLLLDEPAAGVPSGESGTIIEVIERLPPDIALLIIEHDMDLVFRLAQRITVLVQGSILVEGPPEAIAADPRGPQGLSRRASADDDDGLVLEGVSAGYGETVVLEGISLASAAGADAGGARAQRRRQDDVARHDHGPYAIARRRRSALPAGTSRGWPPYRRARLGIGFVPQEREIFPSLTVEENLHGRRARRGNGRRSARSTIFFPSLAERRRNHGNQLSGGEQQMLAIGRALMGNPTLLLMDEPLEGLAPVIVDALLAGLDRLKREDELAMLLVEQHARLALELAPETHRSRSRS